MQTIDTTHCGCESFFFLFHFQIAYGQVKEKRDKEFVTAIIYLEFI